MIGNYVEYSRVVGYMFKAMCVICDRNKWVEREINREYYRNVYFSR
jgi:hypothetical protein